MRVDVWFGYISRPDTWLSLFSGLTVTKSPLMVPFNLIFPKDCLLFLFRKCGKAQHILIGGHEKIFL